MDMENHRQPHDQPPLQCPRCNSTNTKFCYYNNYNLSQPRHFCKTCRRYWTKGGALRNIPVGGATRKTTTKHPIRSSPSKRRTRGAPNKTTIAHASPVQQISVPCNVEVEAEAEADEQPDLMLLDYCGVGTAATSTFSSLLAYPDPDPDGGFLGDTITDSGGEGTEALCMWPHSNSWADYLSIYTPGPSFQ